MGDLAGLTEFAGNSIYAFQALDALIGAFCVIIMWRRLGQLRFRNEETQAGFLRQLDDTLSVGDFDAASELCEGDRRIVPQLALLGMANRELGYEKVRNLIADRFQRDVLADLDHRMAWLLFVIKSAPMLGLLGTVLGMMSAFGKLGGARKVDASQLADDIALALITTFVGLSIAIPLSFCVTSIQVRMRKMEDLVGQGVTRFLESFKAAVSELAARGS